MLSTGRFDGGSNRLPGGGLAFAGLKPVYRDAKNRCVVRNSGKGGSVIELGFDGRQMSLGLLGEPVEFPGRNTNELSGPSKTSAQSGWDHV